MTTWRGRVEPLVTVTTASFEALGDPIHGVSEQWQTADVWPAANLALFLPFSLMVSIVAVKLWTHSGNVVNGNIDIGIYTRGGGRLVSTGSVAQANAGQLQEFDIPDLRLGPGKFYFAVALDNNIGVIARHSFTNLTPAIAGMAQMAAAFPLPAAVIFAAMASDYCPMLGLTTRVLI